jgi:hypothetical protein
MNMLEQACDQNKMQFDEQQVGGAMETVEDIECEEEMIACSCYIAECLSFNKKIDVERLGVDYIRNKVVDAIMALLSL